MIKFNINDLLRRAREEEGQGLAEYAVILLLIVVITIAAIVFIPEQIRSILSSIDQGA